MTENSMVDDDFSAEFVSRCLQSCIASSTLTVEAAIRWAGANLYVPGGQRVDGRDYGRGQEWVVSMLDGQFERLFDVTRFSKDQFNALLQQLVDCGLEGTDYCPPAMKLTVFLVIVSQGASFRLCRELFSTSNRTISTHFHEVLDIIVNAVYKCEVRPARDEIPAAIANNLKFTPFFDQCRGALDGTHIPISIPRGDGVSQVPWRNRKGFISQNVLGVVDFEMNFVYARAGHEGSSNDTFVFQSAVSDGFRCTRSDTYYLADGGYNINHGMLRTPFTRTRYHLKEWSNASQKPQNARELYNLRHASLRNVVERAFGVLKSRFKILTQTRLGFSIATQRDVVYACIALHNFMNRTGSDPEQEYVEDEVDEADEEALVADNCLLPKPIVMEEERLKIANSMWQKYCEYRQALD